MGNDPNTHQERTRVINYPPSMRRGTGVETETALDRLRLAELQDTLSSKTTTVQNSIYRHYAPLYVQGGGIVHNMYISACILIDYFRKDTWNTDENGHLWGGTWGLGVREVDFCLI